MENGNHKILIDKINLFFEIISGKKNQTRNWNKFRELFLPNANLSSSVKDSNGMYVVKSWSVDAYINRLEEFLKENDFWEKASNFQIECLQNISRVSCCYEARRTKNDPLILKKGLNYIHFLKINDDWKIINSIWEDE